MNISESFLVFLSLWLHWNKCLSSILLSVSLFLLLVCTYFIPFCFITQGSEVFVSVLSWLNLLLPHMFPVDQKLSSNKFKRHAIKAFQELELRKMHKLLNEYILFVSQMGVLFSFCVLLHSVTVELHQDIYNWMRYW